MASLTEAERKRLLEQMKELEQQRQPRPGHEISNPDKFSMPVTPSQLTPRERVEGGVYGLLVGDALGVPYEFKPAEALPCAEQIELTPPAQFARSHPRVPAGTWSDDGAQALCLLESLLHVGRFDLDDFAQRILRWFERGHLAVDGHVFDVGIQSAAALRALRAGVPVQEAARRDEGANGNGALMRVLPLALWHRGSDAELVRDARLSSLVTHGHLRSQLCCALYCLWIRRITEQHVEPWQDASQTLRALLAREHGASAELDLQIRPLDARAPRGSGYVVDTLHGARWLQDHGSYERVVKAAVALGDDTDTTAAVCGGAAGVREGVSAIPARWLSALRGRELVEPLLQRLLEQRA